MVRIYLIQNVRLKPDECVSLQAQMDRDTETNMQLLLAESNKKNACRRKRITNGRGSPSTQQLKLHTNISMLLWGDHSTPLCDDPASRGLHLVVGWPLTHTVANCSFVRWHKTLLHLDYVKPTNCNSWVVVNVSHRLMQTISVTRRQKAGRG